LQITLEELNMCWKKGKKIDKAPGPGGIAMELLKNGGGKITQSTHNIIE
jgi:hypothetical protein